MSRIAARFASLKAAGQKAFIPFLAAGDPDLETFAALLASLPQAGCDLIEIGIPFSDPMADGPAIEQANLRAFAAGISLQKILGIVARFRTQDNETPLVLMGYANPLYAYGLEAFVADAARAGVDGLIIVDLPPEEDGELRRLTERHALDIVRLIAPTTDAKRLPVVLKNASGFLYYVSVTGITGSKQVSVDPVRHALASIRPHTSLPIAVGFGITTPEQARTIADTADAVVVGSAIVKLIAANLDSHNRAKSDLINNVLAFVETLAKATHTR